MLPYKAEATKEQRLRMVTIDHKHSKLLGGSNDPDNYEMACGRCNVLKGGVPYEVFRTFAKMVLVPYYYLPLPILRNSLNLYIMQLLMSACGNRKAQRTASTTALLRLKDDIDKHNGH